MKTILILLVLITSVNSFSQIGWVNLGKDLGYDFYYKESTVVRGNNTFVVIVGVPLQEKKDFNNNVISYVTADAVFYESTAGVRCRISNQVYFYADNTYQKTGLPKRDLPLTYSNILLKLYNTIR